MGPGPGDGVSGKSLVADLAGLDNSHPKAGKLKNVLTRDILLLLLQDIPSKHYFSRSFPTFFPLPVDSGKVRKREISKSFFHKRHIIYFLIYIGYHPRFLALISR
jgi:hypothetical protein